MSSRELKKAATRKALVDAAARLFVERGVDGTTMDDIASEAGTSRTSVFNYFGYKEMILCEIGARHVAEIAGAATVSRRRSPRRQLMDMADMLSEIATRDHELVKAIAREMTHPDPERRRQAAETMQYGAVVDLALDMFEEAGMLRDPRHRDSYHRMAVDMAGGVLVRAGGDFPLAQLRQELRRSVDIFLDGILKPSS